MISNDLHTASFKLQDPGCEVVSMISKSIDDSGSCAPISMASSSEKLKEQGNGEVRTSPPAIDVDFETSKATETVISECENVKTTPVSDLPRSLENSSEVAAAVVPEQPLVNNKSLENPREPYYPSSPVNNKQENSSPQEDPTLVHSSPVRDVKSQLTKQTTTSTASQDASDNGTFTHCPTPEPTSVNEVDKPANHRAQIKFDDDHISSEEEGKLIISEGCEKNDHRSRIHVDESKNESLSCQKITEAHQQSRSLKRSAEDKQDLPEAGLKRTKTSLEECHHTHSNNDVTNSSNNADDSYKNDACVTNAATIANSTATTLNSTPTSLNNTATIANSTATALNNTAITETNTATTVSNCFSPSLLHLDESLATLKKDLYAIELLLVQKEEEWNSLLRLMKKKEESYLRLLRQKQVTKMSFRKDKKGNETPEEDAEGSGDDDCVMFLPQGVYSSLGSCHFPMAMMKHVLGSPYSSTAVAAATPQIIPPHQNSQKENYLSSYSGGNLPPQNNVSVIDIHTGVQKPFGLSSSGALGSPQIAISPETQSRIGKQLVNSMSSVKPILPKPQQLHGVDGRSLPQSPLSTSSPQASINPMHPSSGHQATGYGPQGPTVSIQHLIAAHRKDNPQIPPIRRGNKRASWRQKFEGDRRAAQSPSAPPGGLLREVDNHHWSSKDTSGGRLVLPSSVSSSIGELDSRSYGTANNPSMGPSLPVAPSSVSSAGVGPGAASSPLPMSDPSVSYKDVLLQFAQLTQNEKQPGSPQISIIPVSSADAKLRKAEPIPDSTSITRELPCSSHVSSPSQVGQNLESSSALAKLLMESGGNTHSSLGGKSQAVDLSSYDSSNTQCLTLSSLLSGGTATAATSNKERRSPSSHSQGRMDTHSVLQKDSRGLAKKNSGPDDGTSSPNPKCQGCHRSRAQFVCAGCGNQWYCSRHCQVTAWEKHSEHCNN